MPRKDDQNQCFICFHQIETKTITPCNHLACFECFYKYIFFSDKIKDTCPVCQQKFELSKIQVEVPSLLKYGIKCAFLSMLTDDVLVYVKNVDLYRKINNYKFKITLINKIQSISSFNKIVILESNEIISPNIQEWLMQETIQNPKLEIILPYISETVEEEFLCTNNI